MKKIIVLSSGGMDSCALIYHMLKKEYQVTPLYLQQGLFWETAEVYWLKRFISKTKKINSKLQSLVTLDYPLKEVYKNHWSIKGQAPKYHEPDETIYLPGRNMMLITKAALYGYFNHISEIALGPLKGNPFPDSTPKFFQSIQESLSLGLDKKFKIHTPFLNWKKEKVLKTYRDLPWELTFSCAKPNKYSPCNECNKCRERNEVMESWQKKCQVQKPGI